MIAKNASDELRGGFDGGVGSRGRRWRAGDGCRLCALELFSFSAEQFELQAPAMGGVARFAPELESAEILKAADDALADKMAAELKDVVGVAIDPPFGGLVPFGKRSAFPHAVPSKDRLKKGDALILSYTCQIGGYAVECERSFIVGKPTDYAKRLYDAMLAAHDTGVDNLKEGAVAEEVDRKALDQIRKAGFEKFLKHRTGHGIGLEGHEAPWIADGDKTILKQGMTFSCEPGVYDPDWGGVRHSDTVVVRKDKGEVLNKYPTRLEDMVIEI